ncbi:hypothetical protein U9M48_028180, partial [Paspalum notatum var. saurae]
MEVHYHLGKANVVADALSRKVHCNCTRARPLEDTLCRELERMNLGIIQHGQLSNVTLDTTLGEQIIVAQKKDVGMEHLRKRIAEGENMPFQKDESGVLWFKGRLVVPKDQKLRKQILDEAHTSRYTIHPGSNKMYQDLKQWVWWTRMKREIARYANECDVCQRIKADHLRLQPLAVPAWKLEDIHMDFIVGLPKTLKGFDSIWVIVDRFTKSVHFIPVKKSYPAKTYAELYISRVLCLHGIPKTITSDRGSQFTSHFWEHLQSALGTTLIHSSAYHPQTSGQVERVNQILEDMLRARVLTFSKKWDECLHLAEFAYNNSYQKSLEMSPFEALYGRRCRTPLHWSEPGERVTFGPDIVKEAEEKVVVIQKHLKFAQARQKTYADKRRRPLTFKAGDFVYLKVSPMRGIHRFGLKGKLAPRYIGPFKIIRKRGLVAYQLELPPKLSTVHNLKKYLRVPSEVVDATNLELEPDLSYPEYPVRVLDQKERSTRNKTIKFYKVQWSNHSHQEATWETEEHLRTKYPNLILPDSAPD